MNLNEFINHNYLNLSRNYNNRQLTSNFNEYCEFIFVGMKNNVWLPGEYTTGIIIKENK